MYDFNMFNYLKIKGFSNAQLAENFHKIEKANQNINEMDTITRTSSNGICISLL